MHRGQHQRADVRQIEPQRELSPEHAAVLAIAPPSDDFDAPEAIVVGRAEERSQRMKRLLRGHAMQIEFPVAGEFAAAKTLPNGGIDSGGLTPHAERLRPCRGLPQAWSMTSGLRSRLGRRVRRGLGRRRGGVPTSKRRDPLGEHGPCRRVGLG